MSLSLKKYLSNKALLKEAKKQYLEKYNIYTFQYEKKNIENIL